MVEEKEGDKMFNIDKSLNKMLGNKKPFSNSFNNNVMKDFGLKSFGGRNNNVIKNFGLKQFGGKNDWDFDGVSNMKDCQPKNTMRQDKLTQLMRKKVEKLPVYFHEQKEEEQTPKSTYIRIGQDDKLGKPAKEARQYFYGMVKKHPGIISEIEKSKADVLITTSPIFKPEPGKKGYGVTGFTQTEKKTGEDLVIVKEHPEGAGRGTKVLFHELKHVEQRRRSPEEYEKHIKEERLQKLKQWEREPEKEAERYAWKKAAELRPEKTAERYYQDIASYQFGEISEEELRKRRAEAIPKAEQERSEIIGEAFRQTISAPIQKQREWQQKPEMEKDIDRITKQDTDKDMVPDEYDNRTER